MITREAMQDLADKGLRQVAMPLAAGIPADDGGPGSVTRWHQIALEGEWEGHWMGPFKLDARDFDQMIFHFRSMEGDVVVDYEHNTINPFAEKAPASGWITDMAIKDTDQGKGLFGRIRWTPAAAKSIDSEEYRYLSPTILWRTADRKSGADLGTSLHSVALTNTPFLDELPEVRLNSSWIKSLKTGAKQERDKMQNDQITALTAVLGLQADSGFDSMLAHVKGLQTEAGQIERVCNALDIEGATVDAVVANVTALRAENANLRPLAEKAAKLEAEGLVAAARSEGKIVEAQREWAENLAASNPQMFSEWAATAPRVVPEPKAKPPKAPAATAASADVAAAVADLTEAQLQICKSLGITPEQYVKAPARG